MLKITDKSRIFNYNNVSNIKDKETSNTLLDSLKTVSNTQLIKTFADNINGDKRTVYTDHFESVSDIIVLDYSYFGNVFELTYMILESNNVPDSFATDLIKELTTDYFLELLERFDFFKGNDNSYKNSSNTKIVKESYIFKAK